MLLNIRGAGLVGYNNFSLFIAYLLGASKKNMIGNNREKTNAYKGIKAACDEMRVLFRQHEEDIADAHNRYFAESLGRRIAIIDKNFIWQIKDSYSLLERNIYLLMINMPADAKWKELYREVVAAENKGTINRELIDKISSSI